MSRPNIFPPPAGPTPSGRDGPTAFGGLAHLAVTRPLAAVDTETTGLDPATDRVVSVAVVRVEPGGRTHSWHALVHPGRPVPAAAAAVHGLTDAALAAAPPFVAVAPALLARLAGADLLAFNAPFDLAVLAAELGRVGAALDLAGRAVLDPLAVYRRHRPHTLAAAVRDYLGRDHEGAHDAAADALAALRVMDAQVAAHALPADPADLHRSLWPVDVGGRLTLAGGRPALAFGKHRGVPLAAVACTDPGYLRWALATLPLLPDARGLLEQALVASAAAGPGRVP